MRTYRAQIKTTIRPRLGKVKLNQLTAKHLYGVMKDAGLSAKTIRSHHAIISAALHQGVRWGWVKYNVAERAKPPRVAHRRVQAPSVGVVQKVIEEAEKRDPKLAPLLMLAALTGMRRGELCALRWTDVDLELGTLAVSRSVVVVVGGVAERSRRPESAAERWLFPGKLANQPISLSGMSKQLTRIGFPTILARNAARHRLVSMLDPDVMRRITDISSRTANDLHAYYSQPSLGHMNLSPDLEP